MKMATHLKVLLPIACAAGAVVALAGPAGGPVTDIAAHLSHSGQTLPGALRPVLYRALAKDAGSAYQVGQNGCAVLPQSSFKACFEAGGARFSLPAGNKAIGAGSSALGLHLTAYGRGTELAPVTPGRPPEVNGSRVSYRHGNLTEWWRVLPVGFEQGFTLAKRPAGRGELMLALSASSQAKQYKDVLAWGRLHYGGLVVTDANGKTVPATLKSEDNRILIAVNDSHAVYPLKVDPLVWLEQKVVANDGITGLTEFGRSVAVSGDTAIIGEPFATINGNADQGTAYVFTRSDGVWTETQQLLADNGALFDMFGTSVALNGSTAIIGADLASPENTFQGAAYVFTKSGGSWVQAAELTANDGAASDQFGNAVALDGTTALIGALFADVNGNDTQGAAYVFTESGGTWSQTQKLVSSDGAPNDQFGTAVGLDGTTAFVGAPAANAIQGAAYVFTEAGGTWTEAQKLTASDGVANDNFGRGVAIEGSTALIGAFDVSVGGNVEQGAVYAFDEADGSWTQVQKLTESSGAPFDQFGFSIALDDATAIIGTGFGTVNGNSGQGKAYVFTKSGATWSEGQRLVASDGVAGDQFGYSVTFDGNTILIGAPNRNANQGAAYFYGGSDLDLAMSAPGTVGQGETYVGQTIATNNASAASPAVAVTVTVPAAASFVSATATQGSCNEDSGVVTCDFGQIDGNAGTATANVTLKATGSVGDTIDNTASIALATPPLSASVPTTITAGGACPDGYTAYEGSLNPGEFARSPVYQAPGGEQNAILTAPERFQLYAVYQSGRFGRHVYLVPGNEVHRLGPKGLYMWLVRARDGAGAYTLCLQHP